MNILLALRRSGACVAIALGLAATGAMLDLPVLNAGSALAKDGADDGGSHDGGDDHGGGDDRSGRDERRDRDADSGGTSGSSRGEDASVPSGSGSSCGDASVSLELRYADGFREQVSGCDYVLTDDHGRVVITRSATQRDIERLETSRP